MIADILRVAEIEQFLRLIGAYRYDGKPEGSQFLLYLSQLAELLIAVWSPTASIKNQQRPGWSYYLSQVYVLAIYGQHADRGHMNADGKWLGGISAGVDAALRLGCAGEAND